MIKRTLVNWLGTLQQLFSLNHKLLVHIEGGLGSQILGLINFWERQETYGTNKVRLDLSYFSEASREDLWSWQLDRFKINFQELSHFESRRKGDIFKAKGNLLIRPDSDGEYWANLREKYLNRFTYDSNELKGFRERFGILRNEKEYGAVHVRRGDYLKVASRVLNLSEYLNPLIMIKNLIPENLLIISDSKISGSERLHINKIFGEFCQIEYLDDDNLDSFHIHCILREATLLITSNSTFSFSGALLASPHQIAFSPLNFLYGRDSDRVNKSFQKASNFMLLDLIKPFGP